MSDILISYEGTDRARAKMLVDALHQQGWSVWWDRNIPPGKTWEQVIESELKNAGCIIVLWSRTSIESHWVLTEAEEARQRRILVPALLDDVTIPLGFRRIQAANLVRWSVGQPNVEFDELVRAVSEILSLADLDEVEGPARPSRRLSAFASSMTIMPEQWHVFISYSREDNFKLNNEKKGWVTRFCEDLRELLPAVFGRKVEIWYDKRLDGKECFEVTVDDKTANSALLVPVISPAYVEDTSGWLTRERESFFRGVANRGSKRLGNRSRIRPVILRQTDVNRLPEAIRRLNLKHVFYGDHNVPFTGNEYKHRIQLLANDLAEMLRGFDAPDAQR